MIESLHSKTRRLIAMGAGACVLVALGCGLLGVAVQQRVIQPASITMELGPLSIVTRAPRPSVCPEKADPLTNLCDRFSAIRGPAFYQIWLFWSAPGRNSHSTRVLAHWVVPIP